MRNFQPLRPALSPPPLHEGIALLKLKPSIVLLINPDDRTRHAEA
ncbi:MAG: hypothetical protein WCF57_02645 [Pyrinomonadaceae bacterium]